MNTKDTTLEPNQESEHLNIKILKKELDIDYEKRLSNLLKQVQEVLKRDKEEVLIKILTKADQCIIGNLLHRVVNFYPYLDFDSKEIKIRYKKFEFIEGVTNWYEHTFLEQGYCNIGYERYTKKGKWKRCENLEEYKCRTVVLEKDKEDCKSYKKGRRSNCNDFWFHYRNQEIIRKTKSIQILYNKDGEEARRTSNWDPVPIIENKILE